MERAPNAILSVLKEKCPNCRTGNMFINKSIFPLNKLLKMPLRCENCAQKMEIEPGFYYGTGYVSYGLTIALTVFNLIWFALFIGIDFANNSIFWFIGVDIIIVLLFQPLMMRYARVLYLWMFVGYQSYDDSKRTADLAEIEAQQVS